MKLAMRTMHTLKKPEEVHCNGCVNNGCFVKQYCSPTWIGILNESRNLGWYKKGEEIFKEGNRVFGIYFIHHGKVKVVSEGLNGRTQIVRLASDGHILGHKGLGAETYPVGAIALEDTLVCFLDNATLTDAFSNNPKFTYGLMMFYSTELRKTEIRLRYLAQMSLREKVAECMLNLRKIFGLNEEDRTLNIILSRQEIADIAGTNAEQVIRMLSDFENEGLIRKIDKKIALLNVEGLFDIVADHNIKKIYES